MEIEKALLDYYADESNHAKPELLGQRGGAWYSRVASRVMEGLCSSEGLVEVVNTLNRGAIRELPTDVVVEVPCRISESGIAPLPQPPLQEELLVLLRLMKAYENYTISSAVNRSRRKGFVALVLNPLVRSTRKASAVLDDLEACGDFEPIDLNPQSGR